MASCRSATVSLQRLVVAVVLLVPLLLLHTSTSQQQGSSVFVVAQRRPPRPEYIGSSCTARTGSRVTVRNRNSWFCAPGIPDCKWRINCGAYCLMDNCFVYNANMIQTFLANMTIGTEYTLQFHARGTSNLANPWVQWWADDRTTRINLGRGGWTTKRITFVPTRRDFWVQFRSSGAWVGSVYFWGPEPRTFSASLTLPPTATQPASLSETLRPTLSATMSLPPSSSTRTEQGQPSPTLSNTVAPPARSSRTATVQHQPPPPTGHQDDRTRTSTTSGPLLHPPAAAGESRTATITLDPRAIVDPTDDGDVDVEDVRATSVAASGAVVFAVSALVPGGLSAGAVGAPARLAALAQLLLCQQVEDPPLTLLPGWSFTSAARSSIFTELAERAACVVVICIGLSVLSAVGLIKSRTGFLKRGLAPACFVIPAFYAGPAVTGVASQLLSLHLQAGSLHPVDADSGDAFAERPTASDVAVALAAMLALWAHMALVAYSTVFRRHAPAGLLDQLGATLDEIVCGRMRVDARRGLCGLAESSKSPSGVHSSTATDDEASSSLWLRCVVVLEVSVAHVFELLAGIRGPHRVCLARSFAALTLAVLFVVYVSYMQPLASRLEHGFQLGLSVLQAAAGGLLVVAVAGTGELSRDAALAGEWATTAGVWFVILQALVLAVESVLTSSSASSTKPSSAGVASPHHPSTGSAVMANTDDATSRHGTRQQRRGNQEPLLRVVPTLSTSSPPPTRFDRDDRSSSHASRQNDARTRHTSEPRQPRNPLYRDA